jgi:hypothetical protein
MNAEKKYASRGLEGARRATTTPADESPQGTASPRLAAIIPPDPEVVATSTRSPVPEADAPCAPDEVPPTARCAGLRVATHRAPHRSSRPRAVSPCRQDTRVGVARQSAQASSPASAVFGHTATARDPRVCAIAAADRPELPPVSAPCRPDRVGLAWSCAPTRG